MRGVGGGGGGMVSEAAGPGLPLPAPPRGLLGDGPRPRRAAGSPLLRGNPPSGAPQAGWGLAEGNGGGDGRAGGGLRPVAVPGLA